MSWCLGDAILSDRPAGVLKDLREGGRRGHGHRLRARQEEEGRGC